jgi:hypothetical protein
VIYSVRGGIEDWAYAGSWGQGKSACENAGDSRCDFPFKGCAAQRVTFGLFLAHVYLVIFDV